MLAVNAFVAGNLALNPDVHFKHHDHETGGKTHILVTKASVTDIQGIIKNVKIS